ncbi:hypothetical protein P3G55_00010 [Leptospira sp. 96542]|nr:hypothetical protein [Leptospira sp. 96542]
MSRFFLILLMSLTLTVATSAQPTPGAENKTSRSGLLSQRLENQKEIITLYPGFQFRSTNITVTSPNGSQSRMNDSSHDSVRIFLDAKTKDFQLFPAFGTYILVQNFHFDQYNQSIDLNLGGYLPTQNPSLASPFQRANLGTYTKGNITNIMPIFFIGEEGKENFRFGFGVGVSNINLKGNPDMYDGLGTQIPVSILARQGSIESNISEIGHLSLLRNGNLEKDPMSVALLSNLGSGNFLELFGLYQLSKGNMDLKDTNPYTLYWIQILSNGELSLLETITLANMGKSDLKFKQNLAPNIYMFFEVPLWEIVFRFGYGGPLYYDEGYRFTFRNVDISTYLPIDF